MKREKTKHFHRRFMQTALLICCLWGLTRVNAQALLEVAPPANIKSIIFKGPTADQFPIIQLGESLRLEFDDLTAKEQDYYYRIRHCDENWEPSQLLKSQYLDGMDNQRIIDYRNSYNTLQAYSNYQLTIPNNLVRLRVSGNYVLEILDSRNTLIFSRRFVVYESSLVIGGVAKRSRDFNYVNTKQSIQFTINTGGFRVVNPRQQLKVVILQNDQWPTALRGLKPQFTRGTELIYRYDQESSFFGGNEYLNFDTSDLRAPTAAIAKIRVSDVYQHYLYTNQYRYDRPYTYFPDINGDFELRTLQGRNPSREAEYTDVHFSLPYREVMGLDEIYVYGKFNNYELDEQTKMEFNPDTGNFEATIRLKQGFYNFKYVTKDGLGLLQKSKISGDFHFTENNYRILVYFRDFGGLYDRLIGIGSVNSANIAN